MATTSELTAAKRFLEGLSGGENPTPVLAAVSGGLDSMCLLHLLSTWGRQRNLAVTAAHFNHQLRETADRDETFVRDWCKSHEIPFVSGSGDVRKAAAEQGLTLEEAARNLRYDFLMEQQKALHCAFVLTAHHADDNAETMLLNLLRGTGLRGLAGIPEFRGSIARPLLQVTRSELEAYAATHNIPHVEDETNQLDDAARNVLRHHVLPVLRELNPKAVENMTRTARLLAADERTLEHQAGKLLRSARVEPGSAAYLPVEACKDQPGAIVGRAVWSLLISVSGHRKDISATHVEAAMALLRGDVGREVSLPYEMVARREAAELCICRRSRLTGVELKEGCPVKWGGYTLKLLHEAAGEGFALRAGGCVSVAPCAPGGRLRMPGARGSRSVKRLCVDRRIGTGCRPSMWTDAWLRCGSWEWIWNFCRKAKVSSGLFKS